MRKPSTGIVEPLQIPSCYPASLRVASSKRKSPNPERPKAPMPSARFGVHSVPKNLGVHRFWRLWRHGSPQKHQSVVCTVSGARRLFSPATRVSREIPSGDSSPAPETRECSQVDASLTLSQRNPNTSQSHENIAFPYIFKSNPKPELNPKP